MLFRETEFSVAPDVCRVGVHAPLNTLANVLIYIYTRLVEHILPPLIKVVCVDASPLFASLEGICVFLSILGVYF